MVIDQRADRQFRFNLPEFTLTRPFCLLDDRLFLSLEFSLVVLALGVGIFVPIKVQNY